MYSYTCIRLHCYLTLVVLSCAKLSVSVVSAVAFCSIVWGKEHALFSGHNEAGRGMELSELVDFQVSTVAIAQHF
jgi:Apyrase